MTEDDNYEEEAPEETHILDPKQKNPPRGSTKGKQTLKNKLKGKKEKVNYNQRSQPIGKEAIRYTTYLGALARNGWVLITLPDWHHADNVSLDMIWKEMKSAFDLAEEAREQTLQSIGRNWRGFKSRLTRNYIYRYMEDPIYRTKHPYTLMYPPVAYPGITQPVWQNFVASRTTKEFQELRRTQQQWRAANDNPHRMGRKGYANLEVEIQNQLNTNKEIEQAVLWQAAHKNKKGEYVTESDKQTGEIIDSLFEKRKRGEIFEIGTNDILSQALGNTESSGHVRARGQHVGLRDFFPLPKGGIRSLHEMQINYEIEKSRKYEVEIENLKKHTDDIEKKWEARLKALEDKFHGYYGVIINNPEEVVHDQDNEDVVNDKNDADVVNDQNNANLVHDDTFNNVIVTPHEDTWVHTEIMNSTIGQVAKCALLDTTHRKVATGCITEGLLIHGKPVGEENYRVQVDEVLILDALLPIPIDLDEMYLVGHVVSSFVAWPTHLVILDGEQPKKYEPKKKKSTKKRSREPIAPMTQSQKCERSLASSSSSARPPQNPKKPKIPGHVLPNLGVLWNNVSTKQNSYIITVPVDDYVFGIKGHNIIVSKEDVEFMVHLDNITAACISIYTRFLSTILLEHERSHMFAFMEPQLIAAVQGRSPDDRARELAKRLGEVVSGQLLVAPFNGGGHWMLLLIDVSKELVYFFDPLGGHVREDCKNVIAVAFQLHNLTMGRRMRRDYPQWSTILCPQQQDSNTCGFYVCGMMRDLVNEPQPSHYIRTNCYGQLTYNIDQLNVERS